MTERVIKARLLTKNTDICGYTTYVFENLQPKDYEDVYLMCTRFPNWQCREIDIDERGFVQVRYVREGKDTWFDGENEHTYRYTGIHFIKFVDEKKTKEDALKI